MKKLIVPMLVIVAAATSAFKTHTAPASTIVSGFIRNNVEGTNCSESDECEENNTGTLCRVGQDPTGTQLWINNDSGECLKLGYKPM
ncbi:DUF6520 family protein [Flavobacterium granuli]|uniref:Uncharacterized protein n=1 Tax=Flavobacterium granuli TaxID=280093 RepID=A0A1M5RK51_9FLAO|nr:DUF6520 family protein [Flavobacterium granuli]PRZ22845.1 hypothetical protein BC624_10693 [Flavobacterium granuli]SHH26458.1 hypothetical protein SAMN05443373_11028 [Flavobacterium granuli]